MMNTRRTFVHNLRKSGIFTMAFASTLVAFAPSSATSQKAKSPEASRQDRHLHTPAPQASQRKVVQTFAFFGCNRIDLKDWEETKAANPSSANVPQLRQNIVDIARLAPDFLFFGGDLVMGYADDKGETVRAQMSAWIDLVKSLPKAPKTTYVAISGNHELNRKVGDNKIANLPADTVWTNLVKTAHLVPKDASGPTAQNDPDDNLVDDQSALSFSFTRGSVHFVVLNTDTRVSTPDPLLPNETRIGMVPTHWLQIDLDKAERDPKVLSVVVMGHRNVIDPSACKGDAPIDAECGKQMVRTLESHPKVRAYVCAHVHAFDITAIGNTGIYQTTFGNGGSALEKSWKPATGRTFGFGYFKAYSDGSIAVIPYLRPAPANYLASTPELVPASVENKELVISPRRQ